MESLYATLKFNQKISVCQSMSVLVKRFLNSYDWDLSSFEHDEEVVNDLYVYWLRTSATQQYVWCKEYEDFFLSHAFADEMKAKLKATLYKLLITERTCSAKTEKEGSYQTLGN